MPQGRLISTKCVSNILAQAMVTLQINRELGPYYIRFVCIETLTFLGSTIIKCAPISPIHTMGGGHENCGFSKVDDHDGSWWRKETAGGCKTANPCVFPSFRLR